MTLPERLLPESLDELSLEEICDAAVHTAKLIDRSHYDLGRVLTHVRKQGSHKLRYSSVIDFAAAELSIERREAYLLMRLDKLTSALPKIRAAYACGELSVAKLRALVAVVTAETEDQWLEVGRSNTSRVVYEMVRKEAHGRAERGEAPWPESGLYGPLGRPSPARRLVRPYTAELLELESEVWEKHNRAAGSDTSWAEFFEAALVNYGQDIEAVEMHLESHVRETLDRDHWRCRVPECSRRAHLQVHHSVFRSQGGTHEVDRLVALCYCHHMAVHMGLLLIVGRASTGFRFAHRGSVDDGWVFWPGTSLGAEPWVPHAQAFDLDAMADLEPPRPYAVPDDPYWTVREADSGYGSACDRAITLVITGKNPISAYPMPSRASPPH